MRNKSIMIYSKLLKLVLKSFKKDEIFFGICPQKLEKAWRSKLELTSLAWTFKSSSIKLLVPLLLQMLLGSKINSHISLNFCPDHQDRRWVVKLWMPNTLWFQLEDTVLLIGTLLLFDPVLFPKYEVCLIFQQKRPVSYMGCAQLRV